MLELEKIRKCVIPAAGLGKRFYPLTRAQPKEMLPILDKPVIHYVVEEALNSGLDEILIIVGAGKDAIINYFDKHRLDGDMNDYDFRNIPDIYFVRQKEPKGLADAILCAEHFTGGDDFVVLLGDTIYRSGEANTVTSHIMNDYYNLKKPVIAVEKVDKEKVSDYGIVNPVEVGKSPFRIKGVVEKPNPEDAPSGLGITGIYVFGEYIYDYVREIKPGKNGELQLSDAIALMVRDLDVYGSVIRGKRFDIGSKDLWIKTFFEFAREKGLV